MISRVHLHNFKCWADEEVPLGPLTLLTGLNGVGKSTLLQSLLLLRQSHEQGLLAGGRLAINGDLVTLGAGRDAFCEHAEDDTLGIGLSWQDGTEAHWRFDYDRSADVLEARRHPPSDAPGVRGHGSKGGHATAVPEKPPFSGEVFYLAAERVGPRVSAELADYRVHVRREIGNRGELSGSFLVAHGDAPLAPEAVAALGHPGAASNSLTHQVEAWLGEISPGARLHLTEHRDLDAVQVRYSFSGPAGGTNEYRATNVGFGISYTMPILVAALAARPGALLLIENPEAHLHPRGQVRIAGLLARVAARGVQVLVETHSDHVLNGVRLAVHDGSLPPENAVVHFFQRDPARPVAARVSPRMDADGRLEPWPAGFFDELERSLAELLGPRRGS